MTIIRIVGKFVPGKDVQALEHALREAGCESRFFHLGHDEDANAQVLAGMIEMQDAHPLEVWIAPAMSLELKSIDQDRAAATRKQVGIEPKANPHSKLFVTTDRRAAETPLGCRSLYLGDLRSGRITSDELRAIFSKASIRDLGAGITDGGGAEKL